MKFRKGIVVDNKTKIDIKDGFLTAREYTASGGDVKKVVELMVLEFDIADGGAGHSGASENYSALTQDDVPF